MSTLSQPRQPASTSTTSSTVVMAIVSAGIVLVNLDLFIVNVALPSIARDLGGHSLGGLSWVLNGYAIVYAALLVLFGRIADRHDRRNGFLLGLAAFVLASAACAAATSVAMLVTFRIFQAAGAALLTPTSLGLVLASSPPERRQRAVRTWTAIGALGAALGPVIGGLLVSGSWRWVFLVNVPIGITAMVAGLRLLPRVPGHPVPRPDALGAVLVTGGVGALTLGVVQGRDWGWGSGETIVVLTLSLLTLAAFVLHCLRSRNPLVSPALFRSRAFSGASFVATLFGMAFGAMLLSIVLWEQNAWGWSALKTGLSIAPGPLMVPVFSFVIAGPAIARFGAAAVGAVGATVFAAGTAWWVLAIGLQPDYAGEMLGGMMLTGAGVGLTLPTYLSVAAASLPAEAFATGSGVINMLRQIGLAVGVAVLIAVVGSSTIAAERLRGFEHGWTVIAALALLGAVAGAIALPGRVHEGSPVARPSATDVAAGTPVAVAVDAE